MSRNVDAKLKGVHSTTSVLFESAYMDVWCVLLYVLNVHALMSAEISDNDLHGCCNALSIAVT